MYVLKLTHCFKRVFAGTQSGPSMLQLWRGLYDTRRLHFSRLSAF